MAKVTLNPTIREIYGQMDNIVFRRTQDGQIGLMKKPDMSRVVWSPAQEAQRERFRDANRYARAAMADPRTRAIYEREAAASGRHLYRLAVSDYFKGRNLLS